MKRIFILSLLLAAMASLWAAPLKNMPVKYVQPSGDTLYCFASGDEFYHYLHDAQDYVIVQNPDNGYYVYGMLDAQGLIVPTAHVAGTCNPAELGLVPGIRPSRQYLSKCYHAFDIPKEYARPAVKTSGANHGTLNNIVIFIRFSDETSIPNSFSSIDQMFNDSSANAESMYSYFRRASYGNLSIPTHYYPAPSGNTVLSYQDSHPRNYFEPYSATNTNGYSNDSERTSREFTLLQNAVNWINANHPVSTSINLDMDNDGYIDNICFVVSGTYTGWSGLLWPHKWALYDRNVSINGKRVWTFNLQLAGSGQHYFSTSTFCHEMTHTLGCPDLYHYVNYDNVSPAGAWDLMCSNTTPPQQTNSLFKYVYLNWFDSIPLLTQSGFYSMHSLASGPNNAYAIPSMDPNQFYIIEFRNNTDTFDNSLAGSGMLIWRYNQAALGNNADFNGADTAHSLWLFRPNSNSDTINGTVAQAYFNTMAGRGTFNATSNPHPYLCNGTVDTTFSITDIVVSGDSLTFNYFTSYVDPCATDISTFPYSQDFEAGDKCWTFVSADGANDNRTGITAKTDAHGGNNVFLFSSYSHASDYNQFLVSPRLDPLGSLHMTFWYRCENTSPEHFSVRYSSTTNDTASFTHTLFDTTYRSTTWRKCDVLLPHEARYVAINYNAVYEYYLWVDDITLTDTLMPTNNYMLTATANDALMGSVTGGGSYTAGQTATLEAVANAGYHFVSWNDGQTVNPRSVRVVSDTAFVANFAADPVYYTVVLLSNNEQGGTLNGAGSYLEHQQVTISATAAEGYSFESWSDGVTDNPRTFEIVSDTTFTAHFTALTPIYHISVSVWPDETYATAYIETPDGSRCTEGDFEMGTVLTLTVDLADDLSLFTGWSDGNTEPHRQIVVTEDADYVAMFVICNGIDGAEHSNVKVIADGRTLTVYGAEGQSVELFNILGQKVASVQRAEGPTRFEVSQSGVYLLKAGNINSAQKLIVR